MRCSRLLFLRHDCALIDLNCSGCLFALQTGGICLRPLLPRPRSIMTELEFPTVLKVSHWYCTVVGGDEVSLSLIGIPPKLPTLQVDRLRRHRTERSSARTTNIPTKNRTEQSRQSKAKQASNLSNEIVPTDQVIPTDLPAHRPTRSPVHLFFPIPAMDLSVCLFVSEPFRY